MTNIPAKDIKWAMGSQHALGYREGYEKAIERFQPEIGRLSDLVASECRRAEDAHGEAQRASLEIERLREALIEARIFIVNYSDRRYALRALETLEKIGEAYPERSPLTGGSGQ